MLAVYDFPVSVSTGGGIVGVGRRVRILMLSGAAVLAACGDDGDESTPALGADITAVTVAPETNASESGIDVDDDPEESSTGAVAVDAASEGTSTADTADMLSEQVLVSTPGECPLTTAEVATVVGGDLVDMGCGWTSPAADVFVDSFPASLWADYRQQAESTYEVTSIEGLGDEAYLVKDGELYLLDGNQAFSFMVHATDPSIDADAAKKALADIVLDHTQS